MVTMAFDSLAYTRQLEKAGFTREQAEAQAEVFRTFADAVEERNRQDLATKGNLRETELRLQKEIQELKYAMLKWQIGVGIVLAGMMAKGFHWLGF